VTRRVEPAADRSVRARVLQRRPDIRVDTAVTRVDRVGRDGVGLAEEVADGADGVPAEVQERAAAQLRGKAEPAAGERERERRLGGAERPELRSDHFAGAHRPRVEAVHERLHQRDVGVLAVVEERRRLRGVERQRLLTQRRQSRVGRAADPLPVQGVGERVVHRVDVGVEDPLVAPVRLRDSEVARERRRPVGVPRRHRGHLVAAVQDRRRQFRAGDVRRAEHSEAHGRTHGR